LKEKFSYIKRNALFAHVPTPLLKYASYWAKEIRVNKDTNLQVWSSDLWLLKNEWLKLTEGSYFEDQLLEVESVKHLSIINDAYVQVYTINRAFAQVISHLKIHT